MPDDEVDSSSDEDEWPSPGEVIDDLYDEYLSLIHI